MERRLGLVEQQLQLQSNASFCDRSSIMSTNATDSDNLTIRPGNANQSDSTITSNETYEHAFEELLNKSWVYRRNQNREEDMSMRSSVLRFSAWSVLSDISLADIAIITVMSLPVQMRELANGDWYSTKPQPVYGGTEEQVKIIGPSRPDNFQIENDEYDTDDDFKTSWVKESNERALGAPEQSPSFRARI